MSDKFKIIDHATFERMQQSNSGTTTSVPKIRNSKYKRMTASSNFNLLQFAKSKQRGAGNSSNLVNKGKVRKRIVDTRIELPKKKGKQREGGKRDKTTRLKKSILSYRQKKREQEQLENQITESVGNMSNLEVNENKSGLTSGLHSSGFRSYCNCCDTPELKKYGEELIRELNHFQRRAYAQNEIKAKAHRRFIVGFRQIQSYLRINKVKLVFIATNCEHSEGEDVSLNQTIEDIKTICNDQQIPVVFAFRRRQLAYFLYKRASISCVGVLDYDGVREIFLNLVEALKKAQEMYESVAIKS